MLEYLGFRFTPEKKAPNSFACKKAVPLLFREPPQFCRRVLARVAEIFVARLNSARSNSQTRLAMYLPESFASRKCMACTSAL